MKDWRFKDTGNTLSEIPQDGQLICQVDSDTLYFVGNTDNKEFYKYVYSTDTLTQIDIDPDDDSGDGKSADWKIRGLYNDGTYIWLVACENDGFCQVFDVIKVEIATDTATDVGTSNSYTAMYVYDIYSLGGNMLVFGVFNNAGACSVAIWDVDVAPFGASVDSEAVPGAGDNYSRGVAVSTSMYHVMDYKGSNELRMYEVTAATVGRKDAAQLEDYSLPHGNLVCITSDDDDNVYFIGEKDADSESYFITYNITGDSWTIGAALEIRCMLDRENSATAPSETEKGYDEERDVNDNSRIYILNLRREGKWMQYQTINEGSNVRALTDDYLIFVGGEVYKLTDLANESPPLLFDTWYNDGIEPILKYARWCTHPDDKDNWYKKDTIKWYDDSDNIEFMGVIISKSINKDGVCVFEAEAWSNELHYDDYVKSYSSNNSQEKQQDFIDNHCTFCYRSNSIAATATDYSYELKRPPEALIDLIRLLERQVIYTEPDGKYWSKDYDGLTDTGLNWNIESDGDLVLIDLPISQDDIRPGYFVIDPGITRINGRGAAGITDTYPDDDPSSEELSIGRRNSREIRHIFIQAATELGQLTENTYDILYGVTQFVGLQAEGKGRLQPGQYIDLQHSGDISITEFEAMIVYFERDPFNDVYNLMILSDNILYLEEFISYLDKSTIQIRHNEIAIYDNATILEDKIGSITEVLDEDNMASDSDTALATQQSIKAYVDASAGGIDHYYDQVRCSYEAGATIGAYNIVTNADGERIGCTFETGDDWDDSENITIKFTWRRADANNDTVDFLLYVRSHPHDDSEAVNPWNVENATAIALNACVQHNGESYTYTLDAADWAAGDVIEMILEQNENGDTLAFNLSALVTYERTDD